MHHVLLLPLVAAAVHAANTGPQQDTAGTPVAQAVGSKIVGRFNSSGLVVVNGASQKASGVAWWPLAIGDEVEVREASTYVRLTDHNRIVFSKDAAAKMNRVDDRHTYVYLKSGEVRFESVIERLFICAVGHLYVPAAGAEGFVNVTADKTIRAVDSKNSLVDGGNRSCDETGPAAWWAGRAAATASVKGGTGAAGGVTAGQGGSVLGGKVGAVIVGAGAGGFAAGYGISRQDGRPGVREPQSISPVIPDR